jgi:hypothetical protein
MKLHPYQVTAARTLATALGRFGSALDASETGVGKTYTASALAASMRRGVAVVCPKAVIPVWREVLAGFGASPLFVLNYEMLRTGNTEWIERKGEKRTKYSWNPRIPLNTLFIWDEVHKCKTGTTGNAKMLKAAKERFLNLMLSATMAESPLDMRVTGEILGLFANSSDFYWWARDRGCISAGFSCLELSTDPEAVEQGLHKLHGEIFRGSPPRGVRLRSAGIPGFPSSQVITQPWDYGDEGEIARLYAEMTKEIEAHMEIVAEDPGALPVTLTLRARQKAELLKVPLLVEKVEELYADGRSVAVFLNFNASMDAVLERLAHVETGIPVIRGGQSIGEREEAIQAFQSNRSRVILVNVGAGGTGVSLHDVHGTHPRASVICPSFNAVEMVQVLGRVHRNGGTNVVQYFAYAAGTVEAWVVQSVMAKVSRIGLINDGGDISGKKLKDDLHDSVEGVIYPTHTEPQEPIVKRKNKAEPITIIDVASIPTLQPSEDFRFQAPAGDAGDGLALSAVGLTTTTDTTTATTVPGGGPLNAECNFPPQPVANGDAGALPEPPLAAPESVAVCAPTGAAHAKHGPSGLKNLEGCAQFVNHGEGNIVAERGTAMHYAMETGDDSDIIDVEEKKLIAMLRRVMAPALRAYAPYSHDLREVKLDIDLGPLPPGATWKCFNQFGQETPGRVTTFGTVDRLIISGSRALMADYKFGYWKVPSAEVNPQAQAYVLGAFQKYRELESIEVRFYLPRQNSITYHTYTRADVPRILMRIRKIIIAAEDPSSPYTPGDALCEFCLKNLEGTCPAMNAGAIAIARAYDRTIVVPDNVHGSDMTDPVMIASLLKLAPALVKATQGWRRRADELMKAGVKIPGFTHKSRGGSREITSATAAYAQVSSKLTPEEFADCAEVSMPLLLEKYASKFPRGKKGLAKEWLEDTLTDMGIVERGASTLVVSRDHSDAGPAIADTDTDAASDGTPVLGDGSAPANTLE